MAEEFVYPIGNVTPKHSPTGEVKTLPTWEFFYTGTLWRLAHGRRRENVNSVPNKVSFRLERR